MGVLEEPDDPADALARNFLLIFIDVKRFVGVGVATEVTPPLDISADGVEERV